jgi:hypothetical protein
MNLFRTLTLALACLLLGVTAYADSTVGTITTGNCYPFLCNDSGISSGQTIDYQQVYSSTAFTPGVQSINSLTFTFNTGFGGTSTVLGGTYDIYLSTTTAGVGGLSSTDLATNRGTDYGLVNSFSGGIVDSNPFFTINTTPFVYDPTAGNLLLEVIAFDQPGVSNGSGNGYLNADDTGSGVTSRAYDVAGTDPFLSGSSNDPTGLVTTFGTSTVPEPSSMLLLAAGLLGLSVLKLRK